MDGHDTAPGLALRHFDRVAHQIKKKHPDLIILLDEPGLSLHARAQEDLLRYIDEELAPRHQVIYTTHSPFMIPRQLVRVRTVHDVWYDKHGEIIVEGTKVGDDVLSTDPDTVFPLQTALGYELTHSLFVGKKTLCVGFRSGFANVGAHRTRRRQ